MNTLEFLQRVLPSDGLYVTTVINGPEPRDRKQGFFRTVEELAQVCVRLDQTGNNTYYALASFEDKTAGRKQANVKHIKVVAADIDCGEGKPFATWREGLTSLGWFIGKLKLPRPVMVMSGRGVHAYWVFDRDLTVNEWYPLASAFKAAAADLGFSIDPSVSSDSARVMRPVGTHNHKNGAEVKLLLDAPDTTVEAFASALLKYVGAGGSFQPVAQQSGLLANLAVKQDFPPSNGAVVETKCQQIKWAVENQSDVPEPMWYSLIGVAAHCDDAEIVATRWSDQHPDFSLANTQRKIAQWRASTTGPSTCSKIEAERPGGCKGCKFKGSISTPARLGVQYKEVAPPPEAAAANANNILLPRPFKRTAEGIKVTIDDTDIDVCPFDIFPTGYGRDEGLGYETVRYSWNRLHAGWQKISMRQAYLTDGHREFATAIADQGIVLYSKRQTEYFQLMLRSYMDQLRKVRAMSNLYATMGWKEDFKQFVIGDTAISLDANGTAQEDEISLSAGSSRSSTDMFGVAGSQANWTRMTNILEKANMPWHMFALAVGMSAPLYAFTGLKGLTVSLHGPTGGGKTLIQYWIQSIFGDPEKLHFAAKYTQNTLFGRLGMYSNLPMTIDEVTMMQDKEVGDFCYWVSQGRDKARLNRNSEERDAKTWATPVIVSTNKSLASKLIASGLDTDAQMARLLEISIPSHPLFTKNSNAGRKIYQFVTTNYGHIGRVFVSRLAELGPDVVRAMIAEATETFQKRYNCKFGGEERFWEQAIVLADLAARLAKEWGLIDYDYTKGTVWVLDQLGAMRKAVSDNKVDAFDLISEYLNDSADVAVTIMHTGTALPQPDFARMPRADIRVRFDLYRPSASARFDRGTLMVDRSHFRKWLSLRGGDYKTMMHDLAEEGVIATPKSQKYYLGRDTPIKIGQTYVVGVNLNHPRMQGILNDADTVAAADATIGTPLRVVT